MSNESVNKTLVLGFNKDIGNSEYHDDREYISSSGLKMLYKNPREFHRIYVLNEENKMPNQSALDFGSYLHCLILEPHLEHTDFAVFTGYSRRGKDWEKFRDANASKCIITSSQKNLSDKLMKSYKESSVIIGKHGYEIDVPVSSFFSGGEAEETLCVEIEGVKVKVRFDYRKEFEDYGSINDVKTTAEYISTKAQVEKICASWGYDVSAALYCDAAEIATGKPHEFYYNFLSKKDGACRIYRASDQMLEVGRKKYKEAIRRLKDARETGFYYKNEIEELNSIDF